VVQQDKPSTAAPQVKPKPVVTPVFSDIKNATLSERTNSKLSEEKLPMRKVKVKRGINKALRQIQMIQTDSRMEKKGYWLKKRLTTSIDVTRPPLHSIEVQQVTPRVRKSFQFT